MTQKTKKKFRINMNVVGVVIAVAGLAVMYRGFDILSSPTSKLRQQLEGLPSNESMAVITLGLAMALFGTFMATRSKAAKKK